MGEEQCTFNVHAVRKQPSAHRARTHRPQQIAVRTFTASSRPRWRSRTASCPALRGSSPSALRHARARAPWWWYTGVAVATDIMALTSRSVDAAAAACPSAGLWLQLTRRTRCAFGGRALAGAGSGRGGQRQAPAGAAYLSWQHIEVEARRPQHQRTRLLRRCSELQA